eukprot:5542216-Amphidinium_carterae.2
MGGDGDRFNEACSEQAQADVRLRFGKCLICFKNCCIFNGRQLEQADSDEFCYDMSPFCDKDTANTARRLTGDTRSKIAV